MTSINILKNKYFSFACLSFFLFLIFYPATASAKKIIFRAIDQYGKEVAGAHIHVNGYGRALSGKEVEIPEGTIVTYRGAISSLNGDFFSATVDTHVRELKYPFQTVTFIARSQNQKNINSAIIHISGFKSVKSGESVSLPEGLTISYNGRIFGLNGDYLSQKIDGKVTEIVYPFMEVPVYGVDQNGEKIKEATFFISGYGTVTHGDIISVPLGKSLNIKGKISLIDGELFTTKIDPSSQGIMFPFQRVTFKARDQHGKDLTNAKIFITGYGTIVSGNSIPLPDGALISFKGDILSSAASEIRYAQNDTSSKDFNYKIRYKENASSAYSKQKIGDYVSTITVPIVMDYGVPVANAGGEQVTSNGSTVKLDGSKSFSPGGSPLIYKWIQTDGEKVELSDPRSPTPEFTVPADISKIEILKFQLVVSDGLTESKPDILEIKLKENNQLVAKRNSDNIADF